jgi:SARP family transcriptional regulator, regulator of embCAB operon
VIGENVLIGLLGTVSVTVGGLPRDIRAAKTRALLAVLALDPGRPVSYDELADELWAGRGLGNPRNALQAQATRLRRVLDDPSGRPGGIELCAVPNGYLLRAPADQVDATRFLDLASQGAALVDTAPRRAVELLTEALDLWRGPALLDAGDGLRCRGAATLFEERRLSLWEDLATARLAVGDVSTAVADLGRLVAQHPLRETFCALLMIALYRCGRQSDALAAFHRIRTRLDQDLGVQPGTRLRQCYGDILAQDPMLAGPPDQRFAVVASR